MTISQGTFDAFAQEYRSGFERPEDFSLPGRSTETETEIQENCGRGVGVSEYKVLLVDDEQDFLETIVQRMRKRNVNIVGVSNASKALVILGREVIDVVVLDVRMPGIDGIQALREIKKRYPAVEVIMLTGHASMNAAAQGMELGAFDYLMKPANIEELMYKIEKAYKKNNPSKEG